MLQVDMMGITKRFKNTVANDKVDFSVRGGEIHSLLGENGAGKTTLMRILYGMTTPNEGRIFIDGDQVHFKSPQDAIDRGIAMVHQHFMLVEPLSVAENMVLGYEPKKGIRFNLARARRDAMELSKRYGLEIDPGARIESLPVGAKQRVEILKALYRKADLLILDEPTAVLTRGEVDDLFKVLRELRDDGKTIIIITHKLKETMQIADRVTILNAGKLVTTREVKDTNPAELAELMVGRKVSFDVKRDSEKEQLGPVRLRLEDISYRREKVRVLNHLSLQVRAGEILGIAGVEGNGQTELVEMVTGLLPCRHGAIYINEKKVEHATPRKMVALGVGHIPEDRGKRGLVANFSISENLLLGYQRFAPYSRRGILKPAVIDKHAEQLREGFAIKSDSIAEPVSALSGGNQQKVVIARVLSQDPDIIVAAQPTRGVDIGAIEYIHQKLIEMKEAGKAVLLISAELEEIMKLSDRIAVLFGGHIVAEDTPDHFDEYRLGALMTGLEGGEEAAK